MHLPKGSDFRPPWPLRNNHIQTILASRATPKFLRRAPAIVSKEAQHVVVEVGQGVRLTGAYTPCSKSSRGLAILLHGWEGSINSSYMLHTGGHLLAEGWDVFRLNFRDHGNTHSLNEGMFHSCLLDEVLHAIGEIVQRWPSRRVVLAGFSLGGNFALRIGLRASAVNLSLDYVLGVCPVIDPEDSLISLEQEAPRFYHNYFMKSWKRSLNLKQKAFPHRSFFENSELSQNMRELVRAMVLRHTQFNSLESYLDGYSIANDKLYEMKIPATIFTALDDPVVPVESFRKLKLPSNVELDIAPYGGHCGFICDFEMTRFTNNYISARFNAVS